jgi:hypothetical protein
MICKEGCRLALRKAFMNVPSKNSECGEQDYRNVDIRKKWEQIVRK